MKLTPIEFLTELKNGKTEKELNKNGMTEFDSSELKKLIKYGHNLNSAKELLSTDFSDGFTICKKCGSYYHLGNGFTKHLSNGCLNCEGENNHRCYYVSASKQSEGGFPARWMSQMFDHGIHYCKNELRKEIYKNFLK